MNLRILLFCFFCLSLEAKTSMTDSSSYAEFCQKAADTPSLFKNFKRNPIHAKIVETTTRSQGRKYLDIILQQSPELLQHLPAFKENDLYGNPKTYFYPETGPISATTLRYIKIASDIYHLFGSLDDTTIIEIGGGYGGQCKILSDLFRIKEYIIIDLPGPLALTQKYLKKLQVPNTTYLKHTDEIPPQNYDLAISNYAFSECTTAAQKNYLNKVFSHTKNGYLLCNQIVPKTNQFHGKAQLLKMFTAHQIPWKEYPEKPLTYRGNYLLIW